jgi:preprotein translocase subunit SecE
MVKISEFIGQVIKENKKITWSTKKETLLSVMMVIVMVAVASLFFLGTDVVIYKLVNEVLNIGVK